MQNDVGLNTGVDRLFQGKSGLFDEIPMEGIYRLVSCSGAFFKEYRKGQLVFKEDEKPEYLYILLKGNLLLTKHFFSGRRNVFCEIHENEVFGMLVRHKTDEVYWYDAMTMTDCQVFAIPWRFLFQFCPVMCEYHQQILKNLVTVYSDSCVHQMKKAHIMSGITLEAKIAYLMFELADEHGELDFKMNREELADYLGVTRPSLSRSLMNLQKAGHIEIQRTKARILNFDALENICHK